VDTHILAILELKSEEESQPGRCHALRSLPSLQTLLHKIGDGRPPALQKVWRVSKQKNSVPLSFQSFYSSVADPDPYVLGLPNSNPLVRGTDPDLFIIKQK
jgi:hypothetical protein